MPTQTHQIAKPKSEMHRFELSRLPEISWKRSFYRWILRFLAQILVTIFLRVETCGLDNLPRRGAALIVCNHLGDADFAVALAISPVLMDYVAKVELVDLKIIGKLLDAYGMIWVHRGQPDRRAIRAVLQGLENKRLIVIAPEGRESLTSSLEEGTNGAAYLALESGVPVVPVTLTGTENARVFSNIRHFRRTEVKLTIGKAFHLERLPDRRSSINQGTETIMRTLAGQLPLEYQGYYKEMP